MKHLLHITLGLALLLLTGMAAGGCTDELDTPGTSPAAEGFNLHVRVPLRTPGDSSDPLNEYKVNSLHLFFFSTSGHDDATSEYKYDYMVGDMFEFRRLLQFNIPSEAFEVDGLFGTAGTDCIVYAVANVEESKLTAAKTIDALKAVAISSEFDITQVQASFAMDGRATLSLDRAARTVTGDIDLYRAATKLTLSIDVPASLQVENKVIAPDGTATTETVTYVPQTDQMRVWMSNGVKSSVLNTDPLPATPDALYSNEIKAAEGIGSSFAYDNAQPKYKYVQEIPFYSYPNKWEAYSPEGNSSVILEVPWTYTNPAGVTVNVPTYYRISVQPERNEIARNTHYDMRVTLSRLGSVAVQEPVNMELEWNYALEWNIQELPTDIKEIRYLLLNNNDFDASLDAYAFTMDNETEITIPYNTSHPVEIESVRLSWYDYSGTTVKTRNIPLTAVGGSGSYHYNSVNAYRPATDFAGIDVDNQASTLTLHRDIVRLLWSGEDNTGKASIGTGQAISTYKFEINLRHTDAAANDPSAHAKIVVTQYPAIYVTADYTESANYRFINNNNTTYNTGTNKNPIYKGYVGSNLPSLGSNRPEYYLGSVHNDYANNKNTYVIHISKFNQGQNYIIGDPRTKDINNLPVGSDSKTAVAAWSIEKNGRQLQYYYPADQSSAKNRFIAPKFRVASQWGVTYDLYKNGAERRCASYQENGRPAGRWRLPTPAEIEYIANLSNKKYIPYLFGQSDEVAEYWCSSGGIDVDNPNNTVTIVTNPTEARAVRCVYDEWYWGNDILTNKNVFTWGDRSRK